MAAASTLEVSILRGKHMIVFMLVASSLAPVSKSGGLCFPRCRLGFVCCMGVCKVTSCQGHYCVTSSDCSWGETCCGSQCAAESGSVGRSCTHNYDCDVGEKCCLDTCTDTEKCNCADQDSECPIGEICCHGSCLAKSECSAYSYKNPTLVIVGAVLGSLALISLISIFIFLIYRRRRIIPCNGSTQTVPVSVNIPNNTAQNVPTSHNAENQASCGKLNAPPNDYGAITSHRIYNTY